MLVTDSNNRPSVDPDAYDAYLDGLDARVSNLETGLLVEVPEHRDENAMLPDHNSALDTDKARLEAENMQLRDRLESR